MEERLLQRSPLLLMRWGAKRQRSAAAFITITIE
jgi:hypothetical protein